jgi:hypothetical protein
MVPIYLNSNYLNIILYLLSLNVFIRHVLHKLLLSLVVKLAYYLILNIFTIPII